VQLAIGVGQFFSVDHQFKALDQARFAPVFFGERAHFYRIVNDKSGLYVVMFTFLAENLVNELPLAHAFIGGNAQLLADVTYARLMHPADIKSGVLLDGLRNARRRIGRSEIDFLITSL